MKHKFLSSALLAGALFVTALLPANAQSQAAGSRTAKALIIRAIDSAEMTTLAGNVRKDLTAARDMGAVEDSLEIT